MDVRAAVVSEIDSPAPAHQMAYSLEIFFHIARHRPRKAPHSTMRLMGVKANSLTTLKVASSIARRPAAAPTTTCRRLAEMRR